MQLTWLTQLLWCSRPVTCLTPPPWRLVQASTRADEHRRHLARLDWELEQRRRLAADCRQLDTDKRRISQRIGQQRKRLADLAPQLATILQVGAAGGQRRD